MYNLCWDVNLLQFGMMEMLEYRCSRCLGEPYQAVNEKENPNNWLASKKNDDWWVCPDCCMSYHINVVGEKVRTPDGCLWVTDGEPTEWSEICPHCLNAVWWKGNDLECPECGPISLYTPLGTAPDGCLWVTEGERL